MSRFAIWMVLLGVAAVVLQSNQVLGQEEDQDIDDTDVGAPVSNDIADDDDSGSDRAKRQFQSRFCTDCLAKQNRGLRVGCLGCYSGSNNVGRDTTACQRCLAQQRRGAYIGCQPSCGY